MASESKIFHFDEVLKHKDREDCWLLIHNKVFDVTDFLEEHPGGDEVILAATEKDATDDYEDIGHSESAREMMNKYYIGDIDVKSVPSDSGKKFRGPLPVPVPAPVPKQNSTTSFVVKLLQFLLPLLILALALAFAFKKD
ncbi:cytochrome b5-like [Euphorbia lathyris]|uniref:cytochrome b5-like n=1 Tax=Euphorbia lathyris TaxID=212925 RepID=UPI0033144C89